MDTMEKYVGPAVLFVMFLGQCTCSCSDGKYGYNCGYTCNCDPDTCDSTSGCSQPNCSPGWSGPTCHKHNVARGKPTSSSGDLFPSSRATNGNTAANSYSVCIETIASNPNWWRVDLSNIVLIHDVTIYFKTSYIPRRNGIQVYLTDSTDVIPPSSLPCYTVRGNRNGTNIADILSVPCHDRGRYVLLYTTTANNVDSQPKLDFCEVEVDVCDPGTYGADCENYCHCKDGVCNDITGTCLPGGCLSGWKETNCSVKCVDHVEYGPGCKMCPARKCQGASTCPRDTGRCDGGCLPGWEGEDCTSECSNTYGDRCSKTCSSRHCGTASTCDHVTGACDYGCSAGWKDVDCVTACLQGTEYGSGCVKTCSSRMCQGDTSTCPRDTGRCIDGCQAGWKGEDCTEECVDGVEYGDGCVKNCSSRVCYGGMSPCPRDTGRCDGGCQPGWEGEDCTSECTRNMNYGLGCHGNCSARKCKEVSGTCPRETGRCDGGCQPGWEGEDCMLECRSHTFGVNCSLTCGHCVDDEPCHHVTGTCLKGCSPGWVSETCRQSVNNLPGNSTGQISPLAAGFIGAFAMLVIVVVVCLWRKGDFRMAKKSSQESRTPETNTAPSVEVPTYDVLPDNYTKLDRIHTEHYETLQSTVDYQNNDVRI